MAEVLVGPVGDLGLGRAAVIVLEPRLSYFLDAELLEDIQRGRPSRCRCLDDGPRAAHAVPAHINVCFKFLFPENQPVNVVGRVDRLPGCRGRKEVQFGPAADRNGDRVRADLEFAPQDGVRDDAPLRVELDPLDIERLEAGNPSFPDKELLHRGGGEDLYPFGNRILHFPAESGHRLAGFQADDRHVVDTEPDRRPGDVDRDVTAADDHQPAVDPAIIVAPDAPQERQGVQESLVLPPDPREPYGFVRPDGQENGVEPPGGKVREGEVTAEPFPALEVDAALKDRLDVG